MNKTQEMLEQWCSAQGIHFINPEAEESYKRRVRRIADAVQLKVPDRVPVTPAFGMFAALDNGLTCEDIFFDREKAFTAGMKTLIDFEPDTFRLPISPMFALDTMDCRQAVLPGRGISPRSGIQFVEKEYATADEFYDSFLYDPSDFTMRVLMPRIFGVLEPFKKFPAMREVFGYGRISPLLISLADPEIFGAFETMAAAGVEMEKTLAFSREKSLSVMAMGFPNDFSPGTTAPFDLIGDQIRGTRGIMLDMFRRPDKLIAVMEKMVPMLIDMGLRARRLGHNPIVSIPLHKGADGFMSLEQYKTFYWPTLKKVMMGLIEEGFVPAPFFEGDNTSRLEIIKDIPKGTALYRFERINIHRAKEVLGDTVCFRGNVPVSLLNTGTPQQVKDYVKDLIDVVGKGGGLIVDCGSVIDEAKHENIRAMVEFTKEYGHY
jgi:uroporphyrinogen-III decarboxylase